MYTVITTRASVERVTKRERNKVLEEVQLRKGEIKFTVSGVADVGVWRESADWFRDLSQLVIER